MRRHGAHQVAQKSTSTTPFFTSSPKFASVNVLTFSDAMSRVLPLGLRCRGENKVPEVRQVPLRALGAAFRGAGAVSRLYILTYSAADRPHEKSAFMPFFWRRVQTFLLGYAATAALSACSNAAG